MASGENRSAWGKLLHWIGRVFSIPAIIFAGAHLISPDVNPEAEVFWFEWLAVGILFSSVFALVLGWWKKRLGGWSALGLLVLFWIVYGIYAREFFPAWYFLVGGIGLPAALFILSDFLIYSSEPDRLGRIGLPAALLLISDFFRNSSEPDNIEE